MTLPDARAPSGPAPPPAAFVLSGGGAYAAYEVGVMKALSRGESPVTAHVPVDPAVLTGTSAGAFNAALLASHTGAAFASAVSFLESFWIDEIAEGPGACGSGVFRYRVLNALDTDCLASNPLEALAQLAEDTAFFAQDWSARAANFLTSAGAVEQRALELVDLGTFIAAERMDRLIARSLVLDAIRHSPRALRIATTNWRTGALKVFRNQDMTDQNGIAVVRASSAIPGVFHSVEIDGEPYVDGGVVMNTPLLPAIDAGADVMHVVYMDPDVEALPLPRIRNTASTIYRLVIVGFATAMKADIETVNRINRGLAAMSTTKPRKDEAARDDVKTEIFLKGGSPTRPTGLPYRPLTIHRYHPREDLGGSFRWLSFERDHLERLIDQGYADAKAHDCAVNRCVLPE